MENDKNQKVKSESSNSLIKQKEMKKILFAFCMLLALTASAAPVSKEKALEEASAFIAKKNPAGARKQIRMAARAGRLAEVADAAGYYVFNVGNNGGFVIVSGDDRTAPILGYSDEGTFDATRIPANMKAWLQGYADQLEALSKLSDTEAAKVLRAPRKARVSTRNSIAPLITTKWDQATPYWNKCPQFMNSEDEADGYDLAYTGCVATAMSQIMYFYKQPAQTLAEIPAYSFTYGDGNYNYSTVTMDALPVTPFDWEHMRETYTGAEDEVYTDAVATLMFYAGCAVKMQYGRNSSGAFTDDIPKGFKYFGYGSKIAFRNDYTQQAWDDLVYSELAAGRPMIYNGTAGSGGGHSFICDGFEYGDYFHINWGWGGMGNGFFQLSIMNPSASGIGGSSSSEGYNMKQNIIYNIIPGTATPDGGSGEEEEAEPELTVTQISGPSAWDRDRLSDPFKIYKSKIVKVSYSDHSGTGKKFKEALALYDPEAGTYTVLSNSETNNYMTVTTSALGQTTQFGSGVTSNASNVIKFGAGLSGTYRIVPMYQVEGSSEWKPMKESDRIYLEVNMNNYGCTTVAHPYIDLAVTNWSCTGNLAVGAKVQVNATIKNNSEDRFFGDLYLDFGGQQLDEYAQYTTVIQAEVLAGEEKVVTFNVTPATSGTKVLNVMLVDSYGSFYDLSMSGSVTIAESQETEMDLTVDIEAVNADATEDENLHGTIYDSNARFRATITNHAAADYNKYVLAPLFIVKRNDDGTIGGGSMVTYKQQTVSIPAGGSVTYYFDFDNLAYGSTYSMNIYARNNVPQEEDASHVDNIVKKGESKYYDIQRGIITWKGDGTRKGYKPEENFALSADVAAVSLEGLNLSSITASANPNTLYFLGEGETAPAGLENKNVVVGSQAAKVALKDGYDFYTPQTFTASEISYERTFTQGHHNGVRTGWSTIVLPFAPTTVTNATDGKTIDWFRSSSDSGKQFWTCDFSEEDGTTVYFRNAPEMQANVPYLVAVPDDAWGAAWDLRGKQIVWSAENATVKPDAIAFTSGQNMAFGGTQAQATFDNALLLSEDGSQFVASAAPVDAFHGFFKSISESTNGVKAFNIAIARDVVTAIDEVEPTAQPTATAPVFNLSGQRMNASVRHLPRGLYIVGGKKVAVK